MLRLLEAARNIQCRPELDANTQLQRGIESLRLKYEHSVRLSHEATLRAQAARLKFVTMSRDVLLVEHRKTELQLISDVAQLHCCVEGANDSIQTLSEGIGPSLGPTDYCDGNASYFVFLCSGP